MYISNLKNFTSNLLFILFSLKCMSSIEWVQNLNFSGMCRILLKRFLVILLINSIITY